MYGFYAQGSENMVCQHIADWSRQVLNYLEELRERGIPSERLAGWRDRFAALESEASTLLNPWQWSMQGVGAVGKLLDQAHNALMDFTQMLDEVIGGAKEEKVKGWEPKDHHREEREHKEMEPTDINRVPIGEHILPELPYPYDALEPHIDEQTMRLHHDKHHKSYVEGLNKAEREMEEARQTGNFDLIKHWEREAAFHGSGHYLHTVFWNSMSPEGGGEPSGAVLEQIEQDFGSFERFKQHFSKAAEKVEGVGWAIWVWSPRANRSEILTAEKHQNLTQWEAIPLLPLDVWEHAYYLKYQNERQKYIDAWWNVVNWPSVSRRYEKARTLTWKPF